MNRESLSLDALISEPERALELSRSEAVRLLAQLGALEAVVRIAAAARPPQEAGPGHTLDVSDRLLTVEDAAQLLGLTRKQIYRRARRWSFTRRPSIGTLRFSEQGLRKWMTGNTR